MSEKIKLVCGSCSTTNQFPAERLEDTPICASCKQSLFAGTPIEATSTELTKHIQQSDLPVLVDFWAPWCGPCQGFAPIYNEFAQRVGNQLRLLKVDTEANQQAAIDFHIRSIPTLALFRGGQEIARMSGAMALPQLQQWVLQQLTADENI